MTEAEKDTERARQAVLQILDSRCPIEHIESVMVTLEHVVAVILLMVMHNDPRMAESMLLEGLAPGVAARLRGCVIQPAETMQ